jgi:hypothetical protein
MQLTNSQSLEYTLPNRQNQDQAMIKRTLPLENSNDVKLYTSIQFHLN